MDDPSLAITSRQAEQHRITANWIARIKQCMTEGDEPTILNSALRAARISSGDIESRNNIEQSQLDEVLQFVITKVPDISLRLFAKAEISDLGVIGFAAINSGTFGKALTFLLRYHELTSDRYIDSLTVDGDLAVIYPTPQIAHVHNFVNIAEDSMIGNWRVFGWLLGSTVDYDKLEIRFAFPEPDYVGTYREVFGCPYVFESERSEMRFPARWLQLPIASANQTLSDVCTAMCERLLGTGHSWRETPQIVRRLLLSRPGRSMYRLEEVAAELNLSTTQLRKRLYRAGTSYKKLVLEIRMTLAQHYLVDTDLTVKEIAYLLDYSQPAPFSRAFKTYYGISPEHRRKRSLQCGGH